MSYTVRPIATWPGEPTRSPKRSQFDSNSSSTSALLNYELRQIHASDVILEVFCTPEAIRQDGQLRADRKVFKPGVILSINKSDVGALRLPCDTYTEHWDNIRAIALSLEALRKMARYGVVRRNEQYSGWAQLPPEQPAPPDAAKLLDYTQWGTFSLTTEIASLAGEGPLSGRLAAGASDKQVEAWYKYAVRKHHPDAKGDAQTFAKVIAIRDVLRARGVLA